jgi:hypothetical protein
MPAAQLRASSDNKPILLALSEVALLFIRFNIMESVDVNIKGAR